MMMAFAGEKIVHCSAKVLPDEKLGTQSFKVCFDGTIKVWAFPLRCFIRCPEMSPRLIRRILKLAKETSR
jgi:hypothetical protein